MTDNRFVKLTRFDGRNIWINAQFLVTVEARKGGGALVVPMGDGMDYEVRESPEAVIALCAGQNAPTPVAVAAAVQTPPPVVVEKPAAAAEKPSTPRAEPVAAAPEIVASPAPAPAEDAAAASAAKPARKTRAKSTTAKTRKSAKASAKAAASEPTVEKNLPPAVEPATASESVVPPSPVVAAPSAAVPSAEPPPPAPSEKPKGRAMPSDDDILDRVAKMGCRSRTRLLNTLKSQFGKSESDAMALMGVGVEKGLLSIDGNGHVEWKSR